MSNGPVTDEQTQRFAEVVRNFAGAPPKRFAALLPHRDGIAELRRKGASFGTIRELLAIAGIEVAADTVRRFYREVIEESLTDNRRLAKRGRSSATQPRRIHQPAPSASPTASAAKPSSITETPHARGPRIADPRNL